MTYRDTMRTYRAYSELPAGAVYLGGSYPDGSIDMSTLDNIDDALAPVCLIETDGTRHYFETAIYIS